MSFLKTSKRVMQHVRYSNLLKNKTVSTYHQLEYPGEDYSPIVVGSWLLQNGQNDSPDASIFWSDDEPLTITWSTSRPATQEELLEAEEFLKHNTLPEYISWRKPVPFPSSEKEQI